MATVEKDPSLVPPVPPGAPRRVRVSADGSRVLFLRQDHPPHTEGTPGARLWVYEVGSGATWAVDQPGVRTYHTDRAARVAALHTADGLYRADLCTGAVAPAHTAGPATDARPDPTGRRLGYLTDGRLHVVDGGSPDDDGSPAAQESPMAQEPPAAQDMLLAGEPDPAAGGHPHVVWGHADQEVGGRFGRHRGWWWSPDGECVLAARVDYARGRPEVSLHLLELDGGWVDVHWDRETYPYLVAVDWSAHRDPLLTVLRRSQQHGLVLAADARTGETQVHAELADARWVAPVPGTPRHLPDGRVLVGGELAHDGYDARCLFADGTLLTPPSLYVRQVLGCFATGGEVVLAGSAGEPSEQHLFRVSTTAGAVGGDTTPLTTTPGWHHGVVGGDTLVVGSETAETAAPVWTVWHAGTRVGELPTADLPAAGLPTADLPADSPRGGQQAPARPADRPQPALARVTDRRLPTGVVYPRGHVTGRRLPVLVTFAGFSQQVRAVQRDWQPRQEWADTGFAVVAVDHRGTPGVAPSFEKAVHRRVVDVALADVADALAALAGKHPDLDLTRVAAWGEGIGGWLAAMAVLRRPDVFSCAVAVDPPMDWPADDPLRGERYLGATDEHPEVYQHHSLRRALAEEPEARAPRGPAGPAGPGGRLLLLPDDAPADPAAWVAARVAAAADPDRVPAS